MSSRCSFSTVTPTPPFRFLVVYLPKRWLQWRNSMRILPQPKVEHNKRLCEGKEERVIGRNSVSGTYQERRLRLLVKKIWEERVFPNENKLLLWFSKKLRETRGKNDDEQRRTSTPTHDPAKKNIDALLLPSLLMMVLTQKMSSFFLTCTYYWFWKFVDVGFESVDFLSSGFSRPQKLQKHASSTNRSAILLVWYLLLIRYY